MGKASQITKTDLANILQAGLEQRLHDDLINRVVSKHMAAAEKELRENIRPFVEGVTINNVELFTEMVDLTEKLQIEFKWSDESRDGGINNKGVTQDGKRNH
jgi:Ca2+-binding EF-hand superfamily protein